MKVVTTEEMRRIDTKTIEGYGISGIVLMERAGLAVASRIKEFFGQRKIIVLSGNGSNGGDGLVVARILHNEGWKVSVFLTSGPEVFKGDALAQYEAAVKCGVAIQPADELIAHHAAIFSDSVIVDAILGTGLSKHITGMLSKVISLINSSKKPVISVDIPSGISSDNGQVMGEAVRAQYTVTFGLPKRGHFLYPGAEFSGILFIEDIGFPENMLQSENLHVELLEKRHVSELLPERSRYSHKGTYGHVLIVAGSKGKTGAAILAAQACLRSGAGLVTIGIPESLAGVFQSRVTEEMVLPLPDAGDGTLSEKASQEIIGFLNKSADLLAIGPGIGITADTEKLIRTLIEHSPSPLVIDADGINSIRGDQGIIKKAKAPVILTPHPGEMARLLSKGNRTKSHDAAGGLSLRDEIEKDRIAVAMSFAKETGTYLVLKGVPTVIATPDGNAFLNSTGNPGMATAGTGDVLTGMVAGFLSQVRIPLNACILGVFMHGLAGDIAASRKGEYAMIASDMINAIPEAFKKLKSL
jgi:hydroxyethylthiazole kinase-like uncharacterized protein yjeF